MTAQHEQWDIVHGVGLTALAVAAGRALETARPGGMITDRYAAELVRAAEPPVPMPTDPRQTSDNADLWEFLSVHMGLRTRFLDGVCERAAADGAEQAVILAAGLDARAFRLEWPEKAAVFEVDQPAVLDFKDRALGELDAVPACARTSVRADLREDWLGALTEAGFDPQRPTIWLAEGLLPYLPAEAEQRLLRLVHDSSAPGSTLAVEGGSPSAWLDHPEFQRVSDSFGIDMADLLHDDERAAPDAQLGELGWRTDRTTIGELGRDAERDANELVAQVADSHYFVTADLPG
ncbi:SAM-dependent methyltransferase [Salinifilum ghardaiensis]